MFRFLPVTILSIAILILIIFSPLKTTILSTHPLLVQAIYKLGLSQDKTLSCCDVSQITSSDGQFDETAQKATFNNQPINYPKTALSQTIKSTFPDTTVLGTTNSAGEEKWIEVSLDQQMLRAWEGNKILMEFPISSGLWATTPKGTFYIWYKTRAQKMEGGSKELGTYYNLPNVPNNMFFYGGYAVHGAYWHNNFGQPMSHGCVNAPLDKVATLFEWAGPIVPSNRGVVKATADNPGTKVFIH